MSDTNFAAYNHIYATGYWHGPNNPYNEAPTVTDITDATDTSTWTTSDLELHRMIAPISAVDGSLSAAYTNGYYYQVMSWLSRQSGSATPANKLLITRSNMDAISSMYHAHLTEQCECIAVDHVTLTYGDLPAAQFRGVYVNRYQSFKRDQYACWWCSGWEGESLQELTTDYATVHVHEAEHISLRDEIINCFAVEWRMPTEMVANILSWLY